MATNNRSVRARSASRPATARRLRSQVWAYYRFIENNDIAVCPDCSAKLTARGNDGTSHLLRHPCYRKYLATAAALALPLPPPAPVFYPPLVHATAAALPLSPASFPAFDPPLVLHAAAPALPLPPAPIPGFDFDPPLVDHPAVPPLLSPVTVYQDANIYDGELDDLLDDDVTNTDWYKNHL